MHWLSLVRRQSSCAPVAALASGFANALGIVLSQDLDPTDRCPHIQRAGNPIAGDGTKYAGKSIEDICKEAFAAKDQPVINQIGQHYNHIHFWSWMKKGGGGKKLPGKLEKLVQEYGGFDKMRADFINAGTTQFGSGWAWLVSDTKGALSIRKTHDAETPITEAGFSW